MAILKFGEIDINRIYNAQLDEAGEAADARSSNGATPAPGQSPPAKEEMGSKAQKRAGQQSPNDIQ